MAACGSIGAELSNFIRMKRIVLWSAAFLLSVAAHTPGYGAAASDYPATRLRRQARQTARYAQRDARQRAPKPARNAQQQALQAARDAQRSALRSMERSQREMGKASVRTASRIRPQDAGQRRRYSYDRYRSDCYAMRDRREEIRDRQREMKDAARDRRQDMREARADRQNVDFFR